jgi:hypothetical protein
LAAWQGKESCAAELINQQANINAADVDVSL